LPVIQLRTLPLSTKS